MNVNFKVLRDGSQTHEDALWCCSSVGFSLNTYRSCFYFLEFFVFPWRRGGGRSGVGGGVSGNEDMFYSCPYFSPGKPTSNAGSLKVFAFIWNTQTPLESFFIFLFHLTPTH